MEDMLNVVPRPFDERELDCSFQTETTTDETITAGTDFFSYSPSFEENASSMSIMQQHSFLTADEDLMCDLSSVEDEEESVCDLMCDLSVIGSDDDESSTSLKDISDCCASSDRGDDCKVNEESEPEGVSSDELERLNAFVERVSYRGISLDSSSRRSSKGRRRHHIKAVLRDAKKCGVSKDVALSLFPEIIVEEKPNKREKRQPFQKAVVAINHVRQKLPKDMPVRAARTAKKVAKKGHQLQRKVVELPSEIKQRNAELNMLRIRQHWKSPWSNRWSKSSDVTTISQNAEDSRIFIDDDSTLPVNAVAASKSISKFLRRKDDHNRLYLIRQQWCGAKRHRIVGHSGYLGIHVKYLLETAGMLQDTESQRCAVENPLSWDERNVPQYFLNKAGSIYFGDDYGVNWFGKIAIVRNNKRTHNPICHPQSALLVMDNFPDEDEWDEEWYTTWQSRKDNPNTLIECQRYEQYETNWLMTIHDEAPEIGQICSLRNPSIQRISRVHYKYTSDCKKSSWTRKYAPRSKIRDVMFVG